MPSWELPKEIDLELLFKFFQIREESGYPFPRDSANMRLTLMKSALFQRMINGKDPLPIPPPKSFSYPWYELIETGYGTPFEVWQPKDGHPTFTDYPCIVIDQSPWKVIEKLGEDDWIATYPYAKKDEELFADSRWHVYCIGNRIPQTPGFDSSNRLWEIKKIEQEKI